MHVKVFILKPAGPGKAQLIVARLPIFRPIPVSPGSTLLTLAVHHRNLLGLDEFLGRVDVQLDQLPINERPRSR